MLACSSTGKEFSARKSGRDHPSKKKAADESVGVTKKSMDVCNGKTEILLKKQESSWEGAGNELK